MEALLKQIETETGFVCYETANMVKPQYTFYGTSDKLTAFKTLAAEKLATGTIVYIIDTGDSYMYSAFKKTWY